MLRKRQYIKKMTGEDVQRVDLKILTLNCKNNK